MAHSDDLQGHKSIQTTSWAPNLMDKEVLYCSPALRDQAKPFLVQPQTSCSANGLYSSKSFGEAWIWGYRGPLLAAAKSMAAAMCIEVVDSSQEVWYPIRLANTSWNKTVHSSQPKIAFTLSAGVSRPYLPSAPNKATVILSCSRERPNKGFF